MTGDLEEFWQALAARYALERWLGAGGMAAVYLARDLKHGRSVAIKVLRDDLSAAVADERFAREIQIAARLTHPHILSIFDSGEAAGRLYYVMPFVDGESLRTRIDREGRLPVREAVRLAREVAMALHYAHGHGVVHRDIKPENILLADKLAYVADFGIARAISGTDARLTTAGLSLGTPSYMSPEQIVGEKDLDGRSDVYSLACVLHEMLAGDPPFTGAAQAIIGAHLTKPPPPLRSVREDVPPGIEAAVLRALGKEAESRFETAETFAEELGYSVTGPSAVLTTARPSPQRAVVAEAPVPRRAMPSRLAVAALAVVVLVAVGMVAWLGLWKGPRSSSGSLDANRLAIMPFDVIPDDSHLDVWREGIMDILSRNLDGVGSIRTVPPSIVMRERNRRSDRAVATARGRSLGARFVLAGYLQSSGSSVRARASLYDVQTDSAFDLRDTEGDTARMDAFTDTLTVRALSGLSRLTPVTASLRASLGSPSLQSLKAFLRGERLYRQNSLAEARSYYEMALATDPNFALALRRMRGVLRGLDEFDSLSFDYALRAGRANHGLTVRESLLVVADSLAATLPIPQSFVDAAYLARLKRRIAILEEAARRYPDDPEIRAELGEVRFHFGELVGTSHDAALAEFKAAIAVDSAYGPSYFHAIEISLANGTVEQTRDLTRKYLAVNPTDDRFRIIEGVLARTRETPQRVDAWLAGFTPHNRFRAARLLSRWTDSSETALRMLRELAAHSSDLNSADQSVLAQWLPRALAYRGHVREAASQIDSAFFRSRQVPLALLGGLPPARARPLFASWLASNDLDAVLLPLPWWSQQGDTIAMLRVAERSDSVLRARTRAPLDSVRAQYGRTAARAYLLLAHRDSTSALNTFRQLPDSLAPWWLLTNRFTIASLLTASGDPGGAVTALRRPSEWSLDVSEVMWWMERGRVARLAGQHDAARASFDHATRAWSSADPDLQAMLSDAKGKAVR
jgi:serine/threonine protein kinase/tetratricopeptide (TPR) repeat protein